MKKKLKWIFLALIAIFLLLQFFNPSHENPPVKNDFIAATQPPPELQTLFRAACYDCHSHETTWPFYSRIAPLSWQIAQDVVEGRKNLDLSDWPADPKHAAHKLDDMSEQIGNSEMPLKKYTLIHTKARLTDAQRKALTDWLDAASQKLLPQ